MDKDTRNAIERATQRARKLLEEDFSAQLEGDFDVHLTGAVATKAGPHLSARQAFQRERIVAAIEHKRATGMAAAEAVADYLRDAAFTTLNRFVALKMLEARELVRECTKGEQSSGYREFCGMAPGLPLLPDSAGYRLYIECLFDELSTEMKVLFDRRDAVSALWPKRGTFDGLLELLNAQDLASVWREDETIGWVYQYFNSLEERQAMKDVKSGGSQAPRNSRELATRNQFFTPRYIVRFLTDNTLGRLWWEMRGGDTALRSKCEFLTIKPSAQPLPRPKKDPRDLRIIDPACGSGHFLLYVFDLLLQIYDEAWADPESPPSSITGRSVHEDYLATEHFRAAVPELIVRHNLYGVDIDPRCVQVTSFALWLRAQRAFNEMKVPRGGRQRIENSHVILAEAMPGDAKLVRDFAAQDGHPVLAELFEKIVAAFALAGDLGIMLRVERTLDDSIRHAESSSRQGDLFSGATSTTFWESVEAQLLDALALARFAGGAAGRDHERRRLFRHDSAHGLALLDAARTRFDVVLMNPPFGDPSGPSKEYVEGAYPDSRQDIFAVFVDRCVRDLAPEGFVGVISTEAGFFRRTLEPWRRNVLLAHSTMEAFVHLGDNILDTAKVRVAAYALRTPCAPTTSIYIRAFQANRDAREPLLLSAVEAIRNGARHDLVFETRQDEFQKLPYAVFGYWCSSQLRDVFVNNPMLEGTAGRARQGLATADDFRFLRLRWEVQAAHVGKDGWSPFAKGGDYSPFYDDVHLVVRSPSPRSELAAFQGAYIRNPDCYGKRGITWPLRTNKRFAPRALPGGCTFGHKGPAIVDVTPTPWALLAALNSRVVSYLLSLGTGAVETMDVSNSYEVGLVQRIPVPRGLPSDDVLQTHAQHAWIAQASSALREETSTLFAGPTAPVGLVPGGFSTTWNELVALRNQQVDEYVATQEEIDRRCCELYGLTAKDWSEIEESVGAAYRPEFPRDDRARKAWAETVVSFLVGCAFGRWSPSRLSVTTSIEAEQAFAEPRAHQDEAENAPAILVDDPGHPLDLAKRCEGALEVVAGQDTHSLLSEVSAFLGVEELRPYLRADFFDAHLKVYSKSRRTAPIYLPLATAGGQFAIWLYLHRVDADALFTIQSELVTPKLRLEEGRLTAIYADGGSGAVGRKRLAQQQALVEELRTLGDELKRVAPLWKPDLDDGVLINFAPLWRLVPHHKAWQKYLKATWEALRAGDYDWAHLAMRLWPERVTPKCATDRSLAIAHGLEDVFWIEGADGKWKPRATPSSSVDAIVRERSSPAVKAALKSLLEAPVITSGASRGRGRRGAAAAAEGGTR